MMSNRIISKQISADLLTPVLALLKIQDQYSSHHFLFESVEKGNNRSRYSIIGVLPDLIWKCEDNIAYINADFENNPDCFVKTSEHPISSLRDLINKSKIPGEYPALSSGIFGYMSYDMVRLMEDLPDKNLPDEINIPDSIFIRPQILIVFDSLFDVINIHAPIYGELHNKAAENISKVIELLNSSIEVPQTYQQKPLNFKSNFSEEEYCSTVEKIQDYISAGDIFQALPSQRFTSDFDQKNAFQFYRSLRRVNPSPFLFYVKFEDFCLTGSSPEIMVAVKKQKMTVRPLAGTRKRGVNDVEDKKIAEELLGDEKETAEHLMLIDLGRHDVGRVCKAGTVNLTEKMVVENYSHVMHISSNVDGILDEKYDALDALISGFPAGTVSGAPKIRAMQIIEELEGCKRGFYAGCVGYFSGNGDMETCITLRSALIKDNKIHLQAGAGVVFDSVPESEYQECLNKAAALMKAAEAV
ncbi:MAG: anthranilate synthase component 1 [Myxococcota bacterium]|jgi:anthranilate synthase component 1